MRERFIRLALVGACVAGFAAPSVADDAGSLLSGRVADTSSHGLPGARVHIDPRGLTLVTDADGRYAATLSAGRYTVEFSYLGFAVETQEVNLEASHPLRLDATLHPRVTVSEEVTVTDSRSSGEAKALSRRQTSDRVIDVLPSEIITSLPNTNVADAIGRLPSVSLERDEGEGKYVQIRGTEPRLSNVTINGVHVPSPESDVRNIKLDIIPSDLVGAIELNKTLSADLDGDAIGGSVNLVTKTAPDKTYYNFSTQGGISNLLGGRELYQVAGTVGTRFGAEDKGGLILGGTYDWNGRGINDIEPSPDVNDFGDGRGAVPVYTALDIRDYRYQRSRSGFAGGLDYRLDPGSSIFLRGLFSDFKNYGDRWVVSPTAGDLVSQSGTLTTAADNGDIERSVQDRRPHEQIYSLSAGGSHNLRPATLDYTVSFSHSQQNRLDERQASFVGPDGVAWNIDTSRTNYPTFTPTNGVNVNDPNLSLLDQYRIANEMTSSRDASAAINLSLPYQSGGTGGIFKFGGKLRDEHKTNLNQDQRFSIGQDLGMGQFLDSFSDSGYYGNNYALGPIPSLASVTSYVTQNPGALVADPLGDRSRDDPNDFTATERVYAAYAMNTLSLRHLNIQTGLRLERTSASYTGNHVILDGSGRYASTAPVSGDQGYTSLLPSVQVRYEIDMQTNLRAAYGRGISRPSYGDLPPFLVENDKKQSVSAGNPDLKPTSSNNYDLLIEHFLPSVGVLSGGVFYKDLHDPIYPDVESVLTSGPYAGFTQAQAINGEKAHVAGLELTWQQHLTFLPGALSGLGILANYTHTSSKAVVPGRSDDPTLLRTTPNAYNLGITFDRGRLSAKAALTYNDATLFAYNYQDGAAGGVTGPLGDTYLYPHTQLDAQASYRLNHGLQLFASVLNGNNEVFGFYNGSPQYVLQREFYGWSSSFGLRLTH
jgi:TonB-dependent receptor